MWSNIWENDNNIDIAMPLDNRTFSIGSYVDL